MSTPVIDTCPGSPWILPVNENLRRRSGGTSAGAAPNQASTARRLSDTASTLPSKRGFPFAEARVPKTATSEPPGRSAVA